MPVNIGNPRNNYPGVRRDDQPSGGNQAGIIFNRPRVTEGDPRPAGYHPCLPDLGWEPRVGEGLLKTILFQGETGIHEL
jgi:hypothetical protein